MDYGDLIRDAWLITWRNRFLWVLGLFTGTGVGSCSGFGGNPFQFPTRTTGPTTAPAAPGVNRDFDQMMSAVGAWIATHPLIVVAVALAVMLIVLALIVLSRVAQGGMTLATVRLGEQRPVTASEAWLGGLRYFWRFLGLAVLVFLAVIVVVAVIGGIVAIAIAAAVAGGNPSPVLIVLGAIVGVALILAAIPAFIALSVIVAYAQRAMVVDDLGPISGLRAGWLLMRRNLGTSAVVWLFNLGLSIGAGIGVLIAAFAFALMLAILGVLFWAVFRFTAPTIVYIALGVVAWIGVLWAAQAIVNTFLCNYWTLAYLRMTGVATAPIP